LKFNVDRALVLAPHTDDGELGCGGTLAWLEEQDVVVYYAAFSICEESVPEGFPVDILAAEVRDASRMLHIDPQHLTVLDYPVRRFPQNRQEILDDLIRMRRDIAPDLVLLPASDDIHQDHHVIAQEGLRAFKHQTILGYELPWNNLAFTASACVPLERRHIDKKIAALRQYESQWHRAYWDEEFITSLARVRGVQAGAEYAEAFQVFRLIVR
jgi:LmbE family N-acetylglucosaminyl deacetylase